MKGLDVLKREFLFIYVFSLLFQYSLSQAPSSEDSSTNFVKEYISTVQKSNLHPKVFQGFFDGLNNPEYIGLIVDGLNRMGSSNSFKTASLLMQTVQSAYTKLPPISFFEAYGYATEQLLRYHGVETEESLSEILQNAFELLKFKETSLGLNPTTKEYFQLIIDFIVDFLSSLNLTGSNTGDEISRYFSEKLISIKEEL